MSGNPDQHADALNGAHGEGAAPGGESGQHPPDMPTLREGLAPGHCSRAVAHRLRGGVAPEGHGGQAPIWENVPFDVRCARCGQDLRGRTEPKCPACGLEFDWAEAVPIEQLTCWSCGYHLYGLRETRCPECGERFTWEEALGRYHRKRIALFEYQWRKRPIRSFIGTWFRAMVPGLLWRKVTIHDPPQVRPLWVMVAISLLVSLPTGPVFAGIAKLSWMRSATWRATGLRTVSINDLPLFIVQRAGSADSYAGIAISTLWCVTSFASLMVFRQSMTRYQVRFVHVFRVWVYAVVLLLPVWLTGSGYGYVVLLRFFSTGRVWAGLSLPSIHPLWLAFWFGFSVWLIREGYKRYLRMDHSWGVALASQVIAWLAVPALADGLPRILGLVR